MTGAPPEQFSQEELRIVHKAAELAEHLVMDHFKMSESQWLRNRYDIATLSEPLSRESASSPLAQVTAWRGHPQSSSLPSAAYDFYKITLYEDAIQEKIRLHPEMDLFALCLYIVCHELIHVVRFTRFNQHIDVSSHERIREEHRVHRFTHEMLSPLSVKIPGLCKILDYFNQWVSPIDALYPPVS